MTQSNSTSLHHLSLGKRMLIGAIIGLLLISFFLLALKEAKPEWGKFWMIRPLIVEPLAGATAGACNYFLLYYRSLIGLNRTAAIIISVIVSIIGLWMGIVLGLVGTMWN